MLSHRPSHIPLSIAPSMSEKGRGKGEGPSPFLAVWGRGGGLGGEDEGMLGMLRSTGAEPGATYFHRGEEMPALPATVSRTILAMSCPGF